ncbi:sigma-70 family RNA polymerase sigma factor [Gynuella sp.]|uniref:sigma-70 family RNA polymerase sigma factor n=1 Tax=Gynuella sp. TaxID=2969146 RepID=UPI003D0E74DA
MKCLLQAIRQNEAQLRAFLRHRLSADAVAEDLLQEVYLRAIAQGPKFCSVSQPRAWLFRVARNALIDYQRRHRETSELPEDITHLEEEPAPVDRLTECLSRNLARLNQTDRDIIEHCDLLNMTVKSYAEQRQLSLSAAKARLLRARQRLRTSLIRHCSVRFDETGQVCSFTVPPTAS